MATLPLTPAQQQNAVSALYVALFNRAPDAAGFTFWVDGLASGATLSATINAFLASPEARSIYTVEQTPEQFVAAFYETVFGRDADAGGLVYWTDVLNTATANDPETARAVLVTLIIETVSTPLPVKPEGLSDELYAQTVADRDLFGKKVTAGLGFAIDEQGNDLDAAKKVIADLMAPTTPEPEPEPTPSPGPVTPPPPPPPPPGETYVLTTGIDTFVGTDRDDIFDASLTDDDKQTLGIDERQSRSDTLDGGAGTDTLLATLNAEQNFSGNFQVSLKNIEVIKVTALPGADHTFALNRSSGFTHLASERSTFALTFSDVKEAALSVSNQTVDVAFAGSTATNLSLTLTDVGTVDTPINVMLAHAEGWGGAKATTYDIVATDAYTRLSTGKDNVAASTVTVAAEGRNQLALIDTLATSVSTLTVTGEGSVDFSGQALSALTTFTAGDGGVTLSSNNTTAGALTISSGAGDDTIRADGGSITSLLTGAGHDAVILTGAALGSSARLDLGAGDDRLALNELPTDGAIIDGGEGRDILFVNQASLNADTINAVSNFEVLALNEEGLQLDVSTITNISAFMVTNVGPTSFNNARDTSTFEIALSSAYVSIDNANGQTRTDITLSNQVTMTTEVDVGTLSVKGISTIALTSSNIDGAGSNHIGALLHSDEATITVKGDTDLTLELSGEEKGSTLDATGFTGNLHVTGTAFSDRIIGGDGDDIIESGNFTTAQVGGVTESVVITWRDYSSAHGFQEVNGWGTRLETGVLDSFPTAVDIAAFLNGTPNPKLVYRGFGRLDTREVGNWTFAAGDAPGTTVLTSKTPNDNVVDFATPGSVSAGGASGGAPTFEITQGVAGDPATNGSMDTLTGGGGADTFVFNTPDADNLGGHVTAIITDFEVGIDRIRISDGGLVSSATLVRAAQPSDDLAGLLSAADLALDGTVKYFLGELVDERDVRSTYLVTDDDGTGYTNVIELTGVALSTFQNADLMTPV